MCEFISWIELDGDILYLKDNDLATKDGRELVRYLKDCPEDIVGHGAIRRFYQIPDGRGTDKECADFSSPKNFPPQIVDSIKNGEFTKMGVCPDILRASAWEEYKKVEAPAWKEYEKVRASAREEYEKVRNSAWKEYKKVEAPAWKEYEKVEVPAWEEYLKVRNSAWKEYKKVEAPAWKEYKKVTTPALEEYEKVKASAWEEYKKVRSSAFWKIALDPKNRKEEWR